MTGVTNLNRLVTHVYGGQIRAFSGEPRWAYDEGLFTPLRKPQSKSLLAALDLLASADTGGTVVAPTG